MIKTWIRAHEQGSFRDVYVQGRLSHKLGNHKAAKQHFSKVIEMKPDHYWAHHYKSVVLGKLNCDDEAVKYRKKAQELKPVESMIERDLEDSGENAARTFVDVI